MQTGKLKKQTKEVSEIPKKLRLFIYYSWIDWIPLISCKQMSTTKWTRSHLKNWKSTLG